jgi:hypothetical protein
MNLITLLGDTQVFRQVRQAFAGFTSALLVYVVAVWAAAVAVASALLFVSHDGVGNVPAVLALAVVAAYGERGRIKLRGDFNVSISLLPAIFAAVLFGPVAAMVVFGASALALSYPIIGRLTHLASRSLTGAMAAGAVAIVGSFMSAGTGETVAEAVAAALVAESADAAFASLTYWLRGYGRWLEAIKDSLPVIAASVPFYSSAVAVLVFSYRHVSPWTLPLFFAPALAAQRWFLLYQEQRRLAGDLQAANAQLTAANLSFA